MPDLDVVALLKAKPGSEDIMRGALEELVKATLTEEGCLGYRLSVSAADPTVFVTVEKWRGQSDLDAHMQTDHIKQALAVAGPHFDGPPAIHPLTPIVGD